MSTLYDYFAAASDAEAAATLDQGPADPVSAEGIDPEVELGMLESLLTGVDYDTVVDNPRWSDSIADNGEDRCVLTVTDELRAALATADAGQLAAVAVPWSQIDEFDGEAEPAHLAAGLTRLAALARTATDRGQRLYCRVAL